MNVNNRVRLYLDRVGYVGPLDGSTEALADLQNCHLHTVPYENLDILRGVPISLAIDDIFDKIVIRRRGGYCFELNALFGWLLRELGYSVTDLFARFWRDEPAPPPKRRHQVLKVETEAGSYLCDVGVGGIVPRLPLALVAELEQRQGDETYRLIQDPQFGWMLCEQKHGQWNWLYSFTEEPQLPKDYFMASYWCEHAPESIFTKKEMVAIRTRKGRNTVDGKEFRLFEDNEVKVFTPPSDEAYKEALHVHFGIILD